MKALMDKIALIRVTTQKNLTRAIGGVLCGGVLSAAVLSAGLVAMGASSVAGASEVSADSPTYKRGRLLYIQCRACHDLTADGPRKVGPHLAGIIGRPVAAVNDFGYSAALESANLVWDEKTLDQWLQRPSELIPGNTMAFAGIANAADRAALIAYMAVESTR